MKQKEGKVIQSCPTLYDPMDCSPPASSVRGISQAGILEWVAIPPGDLPDPGIKPRSLALQADSLPSEPVEELVLKPRTDSKALAGAKQGEGAAHPQQTRTPQWLSGTDFSKEDEAEGCGVCDQLTDTLLIVGGEISGGISGLNIINLLDPAGLLSTCYWSACN